VPRQLNSRLKACRCQRLHSLGLRLPEHVRNRCDLWSGGLRRGARRRPLQPPEPKP
jgi:ABC-type uncharacterized transport system ATPase component